MPRSAIRPYPREYVTQVPLAHGSATIRPIRPDDEPRMVEFHQRLSDRSVQLRYMHSVSLARRIAHERLRSICFTDYSRDLVFVAIGQERDLQDQILAVGRLSRLSQEGGAEVGMLVRDDQQQKGLGRNVLAHLVKVATAEKMEFIRAVMLPTNEAMKRLAREFGFSFSGPTNGGSELVATLRLFGQDVS